MSTGTRVLLADAKAIADELVTALRPGCERIEIAGSIRRERPDVGDIEIVAVPRRWTETVPDGMFGEHETTRDALDEAIEALRADGVLALASEKPAYGDRYKKLVHVASGLQVDLFAVMPPATWGVLFLIRTGPETFSHWLVAEARRRRFHVVDGALHRGGLGCGSIPCTIVDTPEEGDVMRALDIAYRPPHLRDAVWR